nr:MAG TPA: hypothetical protein [Caudoviricetes sp.]
MFGRRWNRYSFLLFPLNNFITYLLFYFDFSIHKTSH